jgi:hypothetical protein
MSGLIYFEGTKDYVALTPALIFTFKASGSIAAGQFVAYDTGTSGCVYQPAVASGSTVAAGLALSTKTDGTEVPVLVWGLAKNVPWLGITSIAGNPVYISGSSGTTSTGVGIYQIGTVVTGSATGGTVVAFIDCLSVVKS